jgi:diacylglycerol kinase (ATP)
MSSSKNQSFRARLGFACAGILAGLRSEHSLRWQFLALVGILIVLLIFQPGAFWYALVALSSAGVIAAELFNTALEHLADHLHPQLHPNIKIVKDCAAGAVLIASLGALSVALCLVVHLLQTH